MSFSGINTYTGSISLSNIATAVGVSLPGTHENPDTVIASPFNYDVLPNGLATDDTLTITGNGINAGGAGPFEKVGLGQLILPSPNPSLLQSTTIIAGWITIVCQHLPGRLCADRFDQCPAVHNYGGRGGGLFLLRPVGYPAG